MRLDMQDVLARMKTLRPHPVTIHELFDAVVTASYFFVRVKMGGITYLHQISVGDADRLTTEVINKSLRGDASRGSVVASMYAPTPTAGRWLVLGDMM